MANLTKFYIFPIKLVVFEWIKNLVSGLDFQIQFKGQNPKIHQGEFKSKSKSKKMDDLWICQILKSNPSNLCWKWREAKQHKSRAIKSAVA